MCFSAASAAEGKVLARAAIQLARRISWVVFLDQDRSANLRECINSMRYSDAIRRREFLRSTSVSALSAASAAFPSIVRADTKSASSPVRVAVIGTQHAHAEGKIEEFLKLTNDFELVGVVEPDLSRRVRLEKLPELRGMRWIEEATALKTPNVKCVAIETDVPDLVPTAQRCVEAGLHVHLDKPAGESLKAFSRLLDTAKQRHVHIQMGYMFRYNPAFEFAFRALREQWIGNVLEVDGFIGKPIDDVRRRELSRYQGGGMFELGCHLIDAIIAACGKPESISAFGRKSSSNKDDLVDSQIAIFQYPRFTATIRVSLVDPFGQQRRQLVIRGDRGTIDIHPLEPPRLRLMLEKPAGSFAAGEHNVELPTIGRRYERQLQDFASVVRGSAQQRYTPEHDLAVHRAILQASALPVDA